MCHILGVTCHVSCVTCHVSHVTCHIVFLFVFCLQSGEAIRRRVCYHWGLPLLFFLFSGRQLSEEIEIRLTYFLLTLRHVFELPNNRLVIPNNMCLG